MAFILVRDSDGAVFDVNSVAIGAGAGFTEYNESGPAGGFVPAVDDALWTRTGANAYVVDPDSPGPNNVIDPEVSPIAFSAEDTTGGTALGATFVPIPLGPSSLNTGQFVHLAALPNVIDNDGGIRDVSWTFTWDRGAGGNGRSDVEAQLEIDITGTATSFVAVPGSVLTGYSRNIADGTDSVGGTHSLSYPQGSIFRIQARRISGNGNIIARANGSHISISASNGVQGDTGAAGPPGADGTNTINAQDEGGAVGGGPFSTINFIGPDISAASGGGGVLNVTVATPAPPVFGQQYESSEDLPQQTTTLETLQLAHSQVYNPTFTGNAIVHWSGGHRNFTNGAGVDTQVVHSTIGELESFRDYSGPNNVNPIDDFHAVTGHAEIPVTSGVPFTISINYNAVDEGAGAGTAVIRNLRIYIHRVT